MKWLALLLLASLNLLYADGFIYYGGVVTDLGNFDPLQVNDSGEILGDVIGPNSAESLYLMQGNKLTPIGLPGGDFTIGGDLNNLGEVLGSSRIDDVWHPFLYDGGASTDLSNFIPSGQKLLSEGLNNLGGIMFETSDPLSTNTADVYVINNGVARLLGSISIPGSTAAPSLFFYNNLGQSLGVAGTGFLGDPPNVNFVYQNGTVTPYTALNATFNFPNAYPTGLDDAGEFVGSTDFFASGGFTYSNGAFTFLNLMPIAISSSGDFLVTGLNNYGNTYPYYINGSLFDLPEILYGDNDIIYHRTYTWVTGVNDSGEVVGYFSDQYVPEPNSAGLLLAGLAVLSVATGRRVLLRTRS